MSDPIDRNAAIAALRDALAQDPHSKLFGVKRHYIEAILALPPVQPDPLGAEWMRREARRLVALRGFAKHTLDLIDVIPGPTDADLDRAALERPKVQALVEALTDAARVMREIAGMSLMCASDMAWVTARKSEAALAALPKEVE